MIIKVIQELEVEATTLRIRAIVNDEFRAYLRTPLGSNLFCQHGGKAPTFLPSCNDGQFIVLDIDLETGQIKNWGTPTPEQVRGWTLGCDVG